MKTAVARPLKTRRLATPWPFPVSSLPEGHFKNVASAKKPPPRTRLKRIRPSDQWQQEGLL